jgi:ArsR family transcriptional regulator
MMPTDVTISRSRPELPAAVHSICAVAGALRMLADPVRAAILDRLAAEELCVCHLQEELGAKQTLVSHHLRALRDAGLVESEQAGRYTYYRLSPGALVAVRRAVDGMVEASRTRRPRRPC